MSMMGHRVRPIKGQSFRLNPSVTKPYNADFDGDEMNVIVPQNRLSMLEISEITCVKEQIISPQSNSPIIGSIMDNVLGSYILSLDTEFITEDYLYNIILKLPRFNGILPAPDKIIATKKYWSGKTIFSMILPKNNITYFRSHKNEDVQIVNGKFVSGNLTKKIVGSSAGGLIHVINNDIGTNSAADFINDVQILTNRFLKFRGFSVGFDDIKRNEELQKTNLDTIITAKKKVEKYIKETYSKKTKISKEDFEQYIFNTLNKARDDIGSNVMKTIDTSNSFYQMIESGAKGNVLNISQILGSVGQQNIQWNKKHGRVPMILNNRTLPYFHQHDSSPDARGFVEHSYVDGLDVTEFFFHMQAGREGVIDTACKTADVGYLQRKLIKSLEDIKVCYDMTIRNEGNRVVQFAYGGKNVNTIKQEHQYFHLLMKSKKEFKESYKWTRKQIESTYKYKIKKQIILDEYLQLKKLRRIFQKKKLYEETNICEAINIPRIIQQAMKKYKNNITLKRINPQYILTKIEELEKIIILNPNKKFPFNELNKYNLQITRALLRSNLSTKNIVYKYKLSKKSFNFIVNEIEKKFYRNIIDPGTAVGPISAQSIGEPCTQLSVVYDTKVRVKINEKYQEPKIGKLIDNYMRKYANQTIQTHITENGIPSHILPIPKEWNIKVPGLNYQTENIEYKRVTEFSRHPPNGKLIRIKTKSGKTVTATLSHSFVSKRNGKIMTVRGDSLKVGDVVPIIC